MHCPSVVAENEPQNGRNRTLLGKALLRLGTSKSRDILQHAIDLDHSQHEAHATLGEVQPARSDRGLAEILPDRPSTRPNELKYRCRSFLL